ncbi:MAG TPA: ATP-binding protein [Nocardioidaceae bacterium]|nr:ATP-binding protein [Nocardioidaceae bacterium]
MAGPSALSGAGRFESSLAPFVRHNLLVPARVIVLAGSSGSGKSRLAERLGFPVVRLDDFYRNGDDPDLPRLAMGVVDWDDPRSWNSKDAVAALERLCESGRAEVPIYDIAADRRSGLHVVELGGERLVVAEGIFAPEVVAECRARGLLAAAICVRRPRALTFVLRLARDLRERRKPPWVLVRRGLLLYRREPEVVAAAVRLGCQPMGLREAEAYVRSLAQH